MKGKIVIIHKLKLELGKIIKISLNYFIFGWGDLNLNIKFQMLITKH